MSELFYKPEAAWVGDLIPYCDESGKYYLFYLHDPRTVKIQYAEETTWHMVTSEDFIRFKDHGEAIRRGADDRPNKNIYTGSVIKSNDIYYAFYTAYNEDIKIAGKSVQSVMVAKGKDLYHLKTDETLWLTADNQIYESFDWRDPYVFWNQEDHCFWMLLAARKKNSGELRGGCVALCKSDDLINWHYEPPFYAPDMYITMECPEVFQMGEWWYLVYSTFSDRFVTHYRISRGLKGPWIIPGCDSFDSRANYAIKTASDGKRRYAFGWIASKLGDTDFGSWEWGGTMNVHELIQNQETGELYTAPTDGLKNYYTKTIEIGDIVLYNSQKEENETGLLLTSDTLGAGLYSLPEDSFSLEMEIEPVGTSEIGIVLHGDARMEEGYFLKIDLDAKEMAWDMWPRAKKGTYQWQIRGDIPYQVETLRKIHKAKQYYIRIIRKGDICVLYLDDKVALSTRMYNHKRGYGGIYVIQGSVKLNNYLIKVKES